MAEKKQKPKRTAEDSGFRQPVVYTQADRQFLFEYMGGTSESNAAQRRNLWQRVDDLEASGVPMDGFYADERKRKLDEAAIQQRREAELRESLRRRPLLRSALSTTMKAGMLTDSESKAVASTARGMPAGFLISEGVLRLSIDYVEGLDDWAIYYDEYEHKDGMPRLWPRRSCLLSDPFVTNHIQADGTRVLEPLAVREVVIEGHMPWNVMPAHDYPDVGALRGFQNRRDYADGKEYTPSSEEKLFLDTLFDTRTLPRNLNSAALETVVAQATAHAQSYAEDQALSRSRRAAQVRLMYERFKANYREEVPQVAWRNQDVEDILTGLISTPFTITEASLPMKSERKGADAPASVVAVTKEALEAVGERHKYFATVACVWHLIFQKGVRQFTLTNFNGFDAVLDVVATAVHCANTDLGLRPEHEHAIKFSVVCPTRPAYWYGVVPFWQAVASFIRCPASQVALPWREYNWVQGAEPTQPCSAARHCIGRTQAFALAAKQYTHVDGVGFLFPRWMKQWATELYYRPGVYRHLPRRVEIVTDPIVRPIYRDAVSPGAWYLSKLRIYRSGDAEKVVHGEEYVPWGWGKPTKTTVTAHYAKYPTRGRLLLRTTPSILAVADQVLRAGMIRTIDNPEFREGVDPDEKEYITEHAEFPTTVVVYTLPVDGGFAPSMKEIDDRMERLEVEEEDFDEDDGWRPPLRTEPYHPRMGGHLNPLRLTH